VWPLLASIWPCGMSLIWNVWPGFWPDFLNEKLPDATEQKVAKDAKEPATLLASMHWLSIL
jgi:hypothetical protein